MPLTFMSRMAGGQRRIGVLGPQLGCASLVIRACQAGGNGCTGRQIRRDVGAQPAGLLAERRVQGWREEHALRSASRTRAAGGKPPQAVRCGDPRRAAIARNSTQSANRSAQGVLLQQPAIGPEHEQPPRSPAAPVARPAGQQEAPGPVCGERPRMEARQELGKVEHRSGLPLCEPAEPLAVGLQQHHRIGYRGNEDRARFARQLLRAAQATLGTKPCQRMAAAPRHQREHAIAGICRDVEHAAVERDVAQHLQRRQRVAGDETASAPRRPQAAAPGDEPRPAANRAGTGG
ncbi:hypothetical protein [Siccirubricoccus sp. G192]|uniref:hypothetical protein n=1 Tax=Siccirubricoccus sp. G192 TaxID=2849651 RepID=UPI001C2CA19D|nr:hypothetical protein [Siccirubricoccus sp. G192]MBV1800628.1 hypothetical protein [Siccirubricoccus sp. G192]